MSSTAYQRAVADMEAAGLNPAAMSTGGASSPSASGAVGTAASASGIGSASVNPGFNVNNLLSTALQATFKEKEAAKLFSQNLQSTANYFDKMKDFENYKYSLYHKVKDDIKLEPWQEEAFKDVLKSFK